MVCTPRDMISETRASGATISGRMRFARRGDIFDVRADDQGSRRAIVPTAAQCAGHIGDIDILMGAAGDQLYILAELHEYKEAAGRKRFAQAVGDGGDLVVITQQAQRPWRSAIVCP